MADYVYVIGTVIVEEIVGPVKVGVAKSPAARVRELQTGNPHRLILCSQFSVPSRKIAEAVERAFHETQNRHRLNGEWFDMDPISAVQLMCLNLRVCISSIPGLSDEERRDALALTGVIRNERDVALLTSSAGRA